MIPHAKVVVVYWGDQVPAQSQGLDRFYTDFMNGPYLDGLRQYTPLGTPPIGQGSFVGSYTISPPQTRGTITDAALQSELDRLIMSGALPRPDPNTVYMLYLPPGLNTWQNSKDWSCGLRNGDTCAYHSHFAGNVPGATGIAPAHLSVTQPPPRQMIRYAVMPDLSVPGCSADACGASPDPFMNLTARTTHELAETITDPDGNAWYDPANTYEIGDFCSSQDVPVGYRPGYAPSPGLFQGYDVQEELNLHTHSCILLPGDPLATRPDGGPYVLSDGPGLSSSGFNGSRTSSSGISARGAQQGLGQTR